MPICSLLVGFYQFVLLIPLCHCFQKSKLTETSLQWAATHLTLNHSFPIIRLSQPKKIAKPLAHFSRTGGYGNRTPDLVRRKPRRKPLHHQQMITKSTCPGCSAAQIISLFTYFFSDRSLFARSGLSSMPGNEPMTKIVVCCRAMRVHDSLMFLIL